MSRSNVDQYFTQLDLDVLYGATVGKRNISMQFQSQNISAAPSEMASARCTGRLATYCKMHSMDSKSVLFETASYN